MKDAGTLEDAFAVPHDMLQDTIWGANHPNFSDRGLQHSRSFKALKIWMSVQTFGMSAFRRAVSLGLKLARRAEDYIRKSRVLEILNPASLGIVCFRVYTPDADVRGQDQQEGARTPLLGRPGFHIFHEPQGHVIAQDVHRQPHHHLG